MRLEYSPLVGEIRLAPSEKSNYRLMLSVGYASATRTVANGVPPQRQPQTHLRIKRVYIHTPPLSIFHWRSFPGNEEADVLPVLQRPPRGWPAKGRHVEEVGGGGGGDQNEPQLERHPLRPPAPPVCRGREPPDIFWRATLYCWLCPQAWALVWSKGAPYGSMIRRGRCCEICFVQDIDFESHGLLVQVFNLLVVF